MNIFDMFFPPACVGCGYLGEHLCDECWWNLEATILRENRFTVLKDPYGGEQLNLLTVCRPSPVLQKMIHEFKYTYTEEFCRFLGGLMTMRIRDFCESIGENFDNEHVWLAPIPLHASREKMRGFNQSLLLSRYISSQLGWKVWEGLVRMRETLSQATLNRQERLENIRDAFVKCCDCPVPEIVFLVDDVVTTGATFSECRRVLQEAGVREIYGIMLSHGL